MKSQMVKLSEADILRVAKNLNRKCFKVPVKEFEVHFDYETKSTAYVQGCYYIGLSEPLAYYHPRFDQLRSILLHELTHIQVVMFLYAHKIYGDGKIVSSIRGGHNILFYYIYLRALTKLYGWRPAVRSVIADAAANVLQPKRRRRARYIKATKLL